MQWKDVKNYEDLYEVSDTGLVKSKDRTIIQKNGVIMSYPSKILKPDKKGKVTVDGKMYQRVTLSKNHTTERFSVQQLVARTYIDNPEQKLCVNHIDNNPENNCVSNLEWVTHSENMLHAQRQGRLLQSQSAGGKNLGKTGTAIELEHKNIIGEVFSIYTVLDTEPLKRGSKYYFEVRCNLCGAISRREKSYLRNFNATYCNNCNR